MRQLSYFYCSWCIKPCDYVFLGIREAPENLPSASNICDSYLLLSNKPAPQISGLKEQQIIYLLKLLQTDWAQPGSLFPLHVLLAGQTHVFAVHWSCD